MGSLFSVVRKMIKAGDKKLITLFTRYLHSDIRKQKIDSKEVSDSKVPHRLILQASESLSALQGNPEQNAPFLFLFRDVIFFIPVTMKRRTSI